MKVPEQLIRQIHDAPHQGVLAVSGAGSGAVGWLLGIAGASRTVLEVVVPYSRLSMVGLLGFEPQRFVSYETALSMAQAAFSKALLLREDARPALGLACTATIASDRPKRGEHRAHVAAWDDEGWAWYTLHLAKGRRDRAGEEEAVSVLVVEALARACGVGGGTDLESLLGLAGGESVQAGRGVHGSPLDRLLSGECASVLVGLDGRMAAGHPVRAPLLPGSFNPLHRGHEGLARAATQILGAGVTYELSVTNVDKPTLNDGEIRARLDQFLGKAEVVLTRAETYLKKARLFPGCAFVIGWDTAERLVAPRYYGGDGAAMLTALAEIRAAGCSFLVAGREIEGVYHTLDEVPVPPGFEGMFRAIPQAVFREDVSSTSLRSGG